MDKEQISKFFEDNQDELKGQIIIDIASSVGCSDQTVYNYMKDVKNIYIGQAIVNAAKKILNLK